MSVRVVTAAGTLELGDASRSAGPCDRCTERRAQVEVDVRVFTGPIRRLSRIDRAVVRLCCDCLADAVRDTGPDNRRSPDDSVKGSAA